jgi:hypothetical protein
VELTGGSNPVFNFKTMLHSKVYDHVIFIVNQRSQPEDHEIGSCKLRVLDLLHGNVSDEMVKIYSKSVETGVLHLRLQLMHVGEKKIADHEYTIYGADGPAPRVTHSIARKTAPLNPDQNAYRPGDLANPNDPVRAAAVIAAAGGAGAAASVARPTPPIANDTVPQVHVAEPPPSVAPVAPVAPSSGAATTHLQPHEPLPVVAPVPHALPAPTQAAAPTMQMMYPVATYAVGLPVQSTYQVVGVPYQPVQQVQYLPMQQYAPYHQPAQYAMPGQQYVVAPQQQVYYLPQQQQQQQQVYYVQR